MARDRDRESVNRLNLYLHLENDHQISHDVERVGNTANNSFAIAIISCLFTKKTIK